ncbi:MAG: hypothetical protein MUE71_07105 [Chitinophagaceae bacterium]|nr:hypothetical protein [Chitinophagaceae bacterium]
MTKRYVKNLTQFTENELVFIGLCQLTGYNQKPIYVEKGFKGSSTYSLLKKIDMAINQIVSFSSKPLIIIFYLGLFVTFISICYASKIIYNKLVIGIPVDGWTSIIVSIWIIGGIVIFCIGFLGIYLSKIFIEVKKNGTLPVSWLGFNGIVRGKSIELIWKTATEKNNRYFEIMKSSDGVRFDVVGRVNGSGNSQQVQSYQFWDDAPFRGANHYKLKQIDTDGNSSYSKTVYLQFGELHRDMKLMAVTDHDIILSVASAKNEDATVLLTGIDGKTLVQRKVKLFQGSNMVSLPASLPKGTIGVVSLKTGSLVQSLKVIR